VLVGEEVQRTLACRRRHVDRRDLPGDGERRDAQEDDGGKEVLHGRFDPAERGERKVLEVVSTG
jgi:hypothetical protein